MRDISYFLFPLIGTLLVTAGILVSILLQMKSCESDCARIGNTTYYTFPFVLDGKECVAISRYSDGAGTVAINCD